MLRVFAIVMLLVSIVLVLQLFDRDTRDNGSSSQARTPRLDSTQEESTTAPGSLLPSSQDDMRSSQPKTPCPDSGAQDKPTTDPASLARRAMTLVDPKERFEAGFELKKTAGVTAAPLLVPWIASSNTRHRIQALVLLKTLNDSATPLSVILLNTPDKRRRKAIAWALPMIGDLRSVATVLEAMQAEDDEEVREVLIKAFGSLVQRFPAARGKSATELYVLIARQYYGGHLATREGPGSKIIWRWEDGLKYERVRPSVYYLRIAEAACLGALRCDGANEDARGLLESLQNRLVKLRESKPDQSSR